MENFNELNELNELNEQDLDAVAGGAEIKGEICVSSDDGKTEVCITVKKKI